MHVRMYWRVYRTSLRYELVAELKEKQKLMLLLVAQPLTGAKKDDAPSSTISGPLNPASGDA